MAASDEEFNTTTENDPMNEGEEDDEFIDYNDDIGSDFGDTNSFNNDDDEEAEDFNSDVEFEDNELLNPRSAANNELGVKKYKILNESEVFTNMEKRIREISTSYELSHDDTMILLRYLKWDETKLYECDNLEQLEKEAGIIPSTLEYQDLVKDGKFTCSICDEDDIPLANSFSLKCHHRFCLPCWKNYLQVKSSEMRFIDVTCPFHKCAIVIPEASYKQLTDGMKIKSDDKTETSSTSSDSSASSKMGVISSALNLYQKNFSGSNNYTLYHLYRQQSLSHFVQFDPHLVWCTFPNCGSILHCTDIDATLGSVELLCDCGRSLCFPCAKNRYTNSGEFHYPAQCAQATKWEQRTSEELKYFSLRRKPCPSKKCKTPIIKCGCGTKVICNDLDYCPKQACNHMCCPVCNYHFCWICGRDWEGHNDYYNCNKEVSEDLSDHQRFKLCFERYANHNGGQKAAKIKRDKEAKTYFHQLVKDGKTGRNINFMEEACDELMHCYATLKNTYIFAYYAHFDTPALKQLFEYNQGELEKLTDQLQEKIEKETKLMSAEFETDIINLTRVLKKWRERLFQDSAMRSLMTNKNNAFSPKVETKS